VTDLVQYESGVRERLSAIYERIWRALQRTGRAMDEVRVIGVSKYVEADRAAALVRAGVADLGENRWQVAEPKLALKLPVTWHFIGPLQSNKARRVAQQFAWLHSVDTAELATRLDRMCQEEMRSLNILIQVNVAGEAQKSGVDPEKLEQLIEHCRFLTHVRVRGLMMLGSQTDRQATIHKEFATLRTLRDKVAAVTGCHLPELSMGMSSDFVEAVEEGATMVRIGRLLVQPT